MDKRFIHLNILIFVLIVSVECKKKSRQQLLWLEI